MTRARSMERNLKQINDHHTYLYIHCSTWNTSRFRLVFHMEHPRDALPYWIWITPSPALDLISSTRAMTLRANS